MSEELGIRQEYLSEREAELRDLSEELFEGKEKNLTKMRELIEFEEELMKKQYEIKMNSVESDLMKIVDKQIEEVGINKHHSENITEENDLKEVLNKLSKIEDLLTTTEYESKHKELIRYLDVLLENDQKLADLIIKGNEKNVVEKFEPLITSGLTTILTYLVNRQQLDSNKDLQDDVRKLIGMLDKKNDWNEDEED